MDPHEGLRNRWEGGALLVGKIGVSNKTSRMKDGVLDYETLNLRAPHGLKGIVGGAQIGKFRLPS
jgi:hypothetical protein